MDTDKYVKSLLNDLHSSNLQIRVNAANKFLKESEDPKGYINGNPIGMDRIKEFRKGTKTIALDIILTKLLSDEDKSVKLPLIKCLEYLNDPRCVEPLMKLSGSEDFEIRGISGGTLRRHKQVTPNHLLDGLKSDNKNVRINCIHILGEIKKPEIIDPLIKQLKDQHTRLPAIAALEGLKDKRVIKPIISCLDDKSVKVRQHAARVLRNFPDNKSVKKALISSLKDKNPGVKAIAAESLGEIGDKDSKKFLKEILNDKNEKVRIKATEAIRKINNLPGHDPSLKHAEDKQMAYYQSLLTKGEYSKALKICKKNGMLFHEAMDFSRLFNKNRNFIDGNDLINIVGESNLTNFGKMHKEEIAKVGSLFLNDFYRENQRNICSFFIEKYSDKTLTEKDFNELELFFDDRKFFLKLKNYYLKIEKTRDKRYLAHQNPQIINEAVRNKFKEILRECEETVREEMDLPKIGEGWISETELFYKIKDAFPNENVVHHGRPKWLDRQHLDIYLPEKNVAIEYQGEQHQNPIEYFGGEEAFEHRKELDDKKLKACKANNCKLIYVYPDYDFDEIIEKLSK